MQNPVWIWSLWALYLVFSYFGCGENKKRKAFANADREKREGVKLLDFRKVQTSSFSESAFCEKMHVWVSRIFTFFMSYSWQWGEEEKIKEIFFATSLLCNFLGETQQDQKLKVMEFQVSTIYSFKLYISAGPVLWCT